MLFRSRRLKDAKTPQANRCVRYVGLADSSGYAVAAANLVRALRDSGVFVAWEPMTPGRSIGLYLEPAPSQEAGPSEFFPLRDDDRRCDIAILHAVPEYYPYFLERERAKGTSLIVGHTVWETDRLPAHWPDLVNLLDAVIVPTEWNRQVFRDSGVAIPILVAPHLPRQEIGVRDEDRAALRRRLPPLDGRFVFYTISTWLQRKGIEPLINAFAEAFRQADPVCLILKTTRFDLERIQRDAGRKARLPVRSVVQHLLREASNRLGRPLPEIHLLTDDLPDGEIRALHELGDCFVSLSRGEGWGLGAFEAACAANPVVVTGWGGPTAYLTQDNAYFVDWSPVPVQPGAPNGSYTPDQNWAEPDPGSAIAALRAVALDPEEAACRGQAAAKSIRSMIVPSTVSEALIREIRSLSERG